MEFRCLENILDNLKRLQIEKEEEYELDLKISRLLLNNLEIKYVQDIAPFFTILELMDIECIKIYPKLYKVKKVSNKNYIDIKVDDIIINPKVLTPKEINEKDVCIKTELHIVRCSAQKTEIIDRPVCLELTDMKEYCKALKKKAEEYDIGYIQVRNFQEIDYNGLKIRKKLILDLRNNRGGNLNEMKLFFEKIFVNYTIIGIISEEKKIMDFQVESINANKGFPNVCILINQNTASSAEIFALICRYYFGAKIIGVPSYGKNVVCKTFCEEKINYSMPYYEYSVLKHQVKEDGIYPDFVYEEINNPHTVEIISVCSNILGESDEKVF